MKKLALTSAALACGPFFLAACGKDNGNGYSGRRNVAPQQNGGDCMTNGTSVSVELIHSPNHVVVIPKEDVIAGLAKMYTLQDNGSGHTHQITLTMDDFARLQTAQGIQVTSTVNNHAHLVTVNCA